MLSPRPRDPRAIISTGREESQRKRPTSRRPCGSPRVTPTHHPMEGDPMFRKRTIAGLAGATFLATASLAVAQVAWNPDGSPIDDQQPHLTQVTCGPVQTNIVRTQSAPSSTNAVNFVTVPGTPIPINVPDGQTRCVKVLFTAESSCGLSAAADFCYIQAMDGANRLDPDGGGFQ